MSKAIYWLVRVPVWEGLESGQIAFYSLLIILICRKLTCHKEKNTQAVLNASKVGGS
jgi:hypothetical protein